MSAYPFAALRADHVGGHVAMAAVRYSPTLGIPVASRARFQPWECTFHCNDGGPRSFVAFGGKAGMHAAVKEYLGAAI